MQSGSPLPQDGSAPSLNRRTLLRVSAGASLALAAESSVSAAGISKSLARIGSSDSALKSQAQADYHASLQSLGGQLSSSAEQLFGGQGEPARFCDWDVVVIGSGYGGAVCAARLAQAMRPGTRICVLERGREWTPGTFPDTRADAAAEARFDVTGQRQNRLLNPIGLYNAAKHDEVSVLAGSGLGGGSLLNASVAIRPDAELFSRTEWPGEFADPATLGPYYDRAAWMLGAARETTDATAKMRVQRTAMQRPGAYAGDFEPAFVTVTRGACDGRAIVNPQGMRQRPCIDCGDCCSGCNVGAKNTLAMNYLPWARQHGAVFFTRCEVRHLAKDNGLYRIHFRHFRGGQLERWPHADGCITARIVIVSAGSPGTPELLLRSQAESNQLSFSNQLGCHWSGNGDSLAFIRRVPTLTNIGGWGAYPASQPPVGPTIQTNTYFQNGRPLNDRLLVQEGAIARAYSNVLGAVLGDLDFSSTMVLLAMGHDGSAGRISLDANGLAQIKWPGLKESAYRQRVREQFSRIAENMEGSYRPLRAFGDNLVTVHPLGGCRLGYSPDSAVVSAWGEVFDPAGNAFGGMPAVHAGLYVADGSLMPSSLGVNPFLTIAALSERIAEGIRRHPAHADLFVS